MREFLVVAILWSFAPKPQDFPLALSMRFYQPPGLEDIRILPCKAYLYLSLSTSLPLSPYPRNGEMIAWPARATLHQALPKLS